MRRPQTSDPVKAYLREIGRVPLLSHEQEITYGKQVQRLTHLQDLKENLDNASERELTCEEWATHAGLPVEELEALIVEGEEARQKMIEANLRLVVSVAKKYLKRNMDFLDLIQEGTIGLHRAVEKFDPTKGYRFSTYAYWWIRQAITRAIAEQSRTIRLPIHITEKLNKIKKTQRQLTQRLGRAATVEELATELELEPEHIRDHLDRSRRPISLDMRVGDNEDTELGDLLEDTGPSPEDFASQTALRHELEDLMVELSPQQRAVLEMRFGFEGGKSLTLAKIGARLNVSRERVRQIQQEAIKKLRKHRGDLREYLAG